MGHHFSMSNMVNGLVPDVNTSTKATVESVGSPQNTTNDHYIIAHYVLVRPNRPVRSGWICASRDESILT